MMRRVRHTAVAGGASVLIALVLLVMMGLLTTPTPSALAKSRELVLAAYSVPKEAYERRIVPAFQQHWKAKTGETVIARSSYGASGAQARAIIGGLEADVAVLSHEGDLDQLVGAGLITHDWRKGPQAGMISASVVAFGVRKGNPKGIRGWEDLAKPGVAVLYPNPKTSGGAMWDIIAMYGAGLRLAGDKTDSATAERFAQDLLKRIQRNVKVMDKSGRESVTTFERGVGDVIVTYENELWPRIKSGRPYELVVPAETIWIENAGALVDRNVDRHKTRDLAEAFLAFLQGPEARQAFSEVGFRLTEQRNPDSTPAPGFTRPARLITIADLGGWEKMEKHLFGPQGLWTRVVEEPARGQ
jgi:sulfate/thiosulfate transport system substrate-binding protein